MKKFLVFISSLIIFGGIAFAESSSKTLTINSSDASGWSDPSGKTWYYGGYWAWVSGIAPCNNGNFGFFEFNAAELDEFLEGKKIDSATLTVRTLYYGLNGDLGVYALDNNDELTGNVQHDGENAILPRGVVPDSSALIDTIEAPIAVETTVQFDVANYIQDLLDGADLPAYIGFEFYGATATSDTYLYSVGEQYNPTLVIYASPIPEPSAYAAIFGALALGFAIYRKRK